MFISFRAKKWQGEIFDKEHNFQDRKFLGSNFKGTYHGIFWNLGGIDIPRYVNMAKMVSSWWFKLNLMLVKLDHLHPTFGLNMFKSPPKKALKPPPKCGKTICRNILLFSFSTSPPTPLWERLVSSRPFRLDRVFKAGTGAGTG